MSNSSFSIRSGEDKRSRSPKQSTDIQKLRERSDIQKEHLNDYMKQIDKVKMKIQNLTVNYRGSALRNMREWEKKEGSLGRFKDNIPQNINEEKKINEQKNGLKRNELMKLIESHRNNEDLKGASRGFLTGETNNELEKYDMRKKSEADEKKLSEKLFVESSKKYGSLEQTSHLFVPADRELKDYAEDDSKSAFKNNSTKEIIEESDEILRQTKLRQKMNEDKKVDTSFNEQKEAHNFTKTHLTDFVIGKNEKISQWTEANKSKELNGAHLFDERVSHNIRRENPKIFTESGSGNFNYSWQNQSAEKNEQLVSPTFDKTTINSNQKQQNIFSNEKNKIYDSEKTETSPLVSQTLPKKKQVEPTRDETPKKNVIGNKQTGINNLESGNYKIDSFQILKPDFLRKENLLQKREQKVVPVNELQKYITSEENLSNNKPESTNEYLDEKKQERKQLAVQEHIKKQSKDELSFQKLNKNPLSIKFNYNRIQTIKAFSRESKLKKIENNITKIGTLFTVPHKFLMSSELNKVSNPKTLLVQSKSNALNNEIVELELLRKQNQRLTERTEDLKKQLEKQTSQKKEPSKLLEETRTLDFKKEKQAIELKKNLIEQNYVLSFLNKSALEKNLMSTSSLRNIDQKNPNDKLASHTNEVRFLNISIAKLQQEVDFLNQQITIAEMERNNSSFVYRKSCEEIKTLRANIDFLKNDLSQHKSMIAMITDLIMASQNEELCDGLTRILDLKPEGTINL